MGCFVVLFALISPRLALFALFLFSDLLSRAYDSWIVPLLGFFLLPWTTLAYAVMWSAGTHGVNGFEWFIVVLAFLFDLGSWREGRGRAARQRLRPAAGGCSLAPTSSIGKAIRTCSLPTTMNGRHDLAAAVERQVISTSTTGMKLTSGRLSESEKRLW